MNMNTIIQGANILVVDDNLLNYEVIAMTLRKQKFNIVYAENGLKAIELTQTNTYDLILLDIMMPDLNGYEVCELIKKNPQTASIPIMFLSALTETQDKVKAFELGGVDYITKPISPNELVARVSTHVKIGMLEKELMHTNNNLEKLVAQSSKDLATNQKEYKLLVENQNDYILRTNSYDHITFASPNFLEITNLKEDNVKNASFKDIIYKKDIDNVVSIKKTLEVAPYKLDFIARIETTNGLRWIEWSCKGTPTLNNSYDGFIAVGRDITSKKDYEDKMLINQFIVDLSGVASACLLTNGNLSYSNNSFKRIFDIREEDIMQSKFHPENLFSVSKDEWFDLITNLRTSNSAKFETIVLGNHTKPMYVEVFLNLLTHNKNEYVIAFVKEVTDEKQNLQKLMNAVIDAEQRQNLILQNKFNKEIESLFSGIDHFTKELSQKENTQAKQELLLNKISNLLENTSISKRIFQDELPPNDLKIQTIEAYLKSYTNKLSTSYKIDYDFNIELSRKIKNDEIFAKFIYKLCIELIQNSVKNYHARNIEILLSLHSSHCHFIYTDTGINANASTKKQRYNDLSYITDRLQSIGIDYNLRNSDTKGICLEIDFNL